MKQKKSLNKLFKKDKQHIEATLNNEDKIHIKKENTSQNEK